MVGAYFINHVLLLDMQVLTVTQGTIQILVADLNHSSKQNYCFARHCLCFPRSESVSKAVTCLENNKKNTFARGSWPSQLVCTVYQSQTETK